MYYYTKQIDAENIMVASGTKLPKNMDGVTIITQEEYIDRIAEIEAAAAESSKDDVIEEDYQQALALLGVE